MEGESQGQGEKARERESERTFTRVRENARAPRGAREVVPAHLSLYISLAFSVSLSLAPSLPPSLPPSYQPSSGWRNKGRKADDDQHRDFGAQPHAPHPTCVMHAKRCVTLGRCTPLG